MFQNKKKTTVYLNEDLRYICRDPFIYRPGSLQRCPGGLYQVFGQSWDRATH